MNLPDHPWYGNSMILWELAKQLQFKYLSIRKPNVHYNPNGKEPRHRRKFEQVRYLLGYRPELIVSSVNKYGGFQPNFKFYFDLTYWKETPMFSFDKSKREKNRIDFADRWKDYYAGYDYAIDLDAVDKNPLTAWKEAKLIKDLFDHNKIPYSVKFSGSKGFHFLIPYKFLPKRINPMNLPNACATTTTWLIDRFNFESVDDSIYDHRRILKLAYSLDGNFVCLPLNDYQFDNFRLEDMQAATVLKKVKLFDRGLIFRDFGLSAAQLRKNVQKLFKGGISWQEKRK